MYQIQDTYSLKLSQRLVRTESQISELKIMLKAMSTLLSDAVIRQSNMSRDKFNELEEWINCLAQSSISPDIWKEIKTLEDVLAKHSKSSDNDSDNMNSSLNSLCVKLSHVYAKMQNKEQTCMNICETISNLSSNDEDKNKELRKELNVVEQIQKDNKILMDEIVQQLNTLSQKNGCEKKM